MKSLHSAHLHILSFQSAASQFTRTHATHYYPKCPPKNSLLLVILRHKKLSNQPIIPIIAKEPSWSAHLEISPFPIIHSSKSHRSKFHLTSPSIQAPSSNYHPSRSTGTISQPRPLSATYYHPAYLSVSTKREFRGLKLRP
ncbi:hypothetical protein BDZ45DRAFT_94836 [Acephala macrosclerotiorum]|nr:hypothetical protein BDZ45DRAFT_94836 [Acephala macrosclerotiorum]